LNYPADALTAIILLTRIDINNFTQVHRYQTEHNSVLIAINEIALHIRYANMLVSFLGAF